jgi:hypothetical protein
VREIGNSEQESIVLTSLGLVCICIEDYIQALDYNKQGLEVAQKIGYRTQEAWGTCNIGKTLMRMNQYQEEFYKVPKGLEDPSDKTPEKHGPLWYLATIPPRLLHFLYEGSEKVEEQSSTALSDEELIRMNEGLSVKNLCFSEFVVA